MNSLIIAQATFSSLKKRNAISIRNLSEQLFEQEVLFHTLSFKFCQNTTTNKVVPNIHKLQPSKSQDQKNYFQKLVFVENQETE